VEISDNAPLTLGKSKETPADVLKPFTEGGYPKYPVGQIIFDINGEYANPNLQDQGTAIFDLFKAKTVRYSTIEQPGTDFGVMKVNFYREIESGFELIRSHPKVADDDARFVSGFSAYGRNPYFGRGMAFNPNEMLLFADGLPGVFRATRRQYFEISDLEGKFRHNPYSQKVRAVPFF
jgi:hypothetical protein